MECFIQIDRGAMAPVLFILLQLHVPSDNFLNRLTSEIQIEKAC